MVGSFLTKTPLLITIYMKMFLLFHLIPDRYDEIRDFFLYPPMLTSMSELSNTSGEW